MQFLSELLSIKENLEVEKLLEDLGNLKQLGLGRMVNALKQSYRYYDDGRRKYTDSGPRASDVGNKIRARQVGIGPNSEIVDVKGNVKNWGTIKKAYRENAEKKPCAIVLYVSDKACVLLVGDLESMSGAKKVFGLSYDFTGLLDENEVKQVVSGLDDFKADSRGRYYGIAKQETEPKGSGRTVAHKNNYYNNDNVEIRHYEGFGVTHKNINAFIDNLIGEVGDRLKAKIILTDSGIYDKAKKRAENQPIKPEDIKIFKDDLKTRLEKYKLNNADNASTVKEFIDKVFNGSGKKIKFAGETYESKPGTHRYASYSGPGGIEKMMKGGSVDINYYAATKPDDYYSDDKYITVTVKLVNMTLTPVSVRYREYSENDRGRMVGSAWKTEDLR